MTKTKSYLVVYDVEGDVFLAKTRLTEDQAQTVENLSCVYSLRQLPLKNLEGMTAEDVLALRSEFEEEEE